MDILLGGPSVQCCEVLNSFVTENTIKIRMVGGPPPVPTPMASRMPMLTS